MKAGSITSASPCRTSQALAFFGTPWACTSSGPKRSPASGCARISSRRALEARAARGDGPDSAIAKFIEKRGPGCITWPCASTTSMPRWPTSGRGRAADRRTPRPGAEGALRGVHPPVGAHGVLVELKQPAPTVPPRFRTPTRRTRSATSSSSACRTASSRSTAARCSASCRGRCGRSAPPDDRNRIPLGMRPLIVRGAETVLIDAGCGDKMDAKSAEIYGLERAYHLDHALAEAGLSVDDIDIVAGQPPALRPCGRLHAARRRRAYRAALPEGALPRAPAGVGGRDAPARAQPRELPAGELRAAEGRRRADAGGRRRGVMPGVTYRRSRGPHHAPPGGDDRVGRGETAVFTADMYPTSAHVPDPWVMGYDLYPTDWHHRRQRPLRHGGADRPRRASALTTPFGDPSGPYVLGTLRGKRVAFLARHGAGHRLSPSELNFRANIYGFKLLGVEWILSASAVGQPEGEYKPLDIVFPDQFIDRTSGASARSSATGSWRTSASRTPSAAAATLAHRRGGRRWAHACTRAAPTSAWKGRSSRRWPNRAVPVVGHGHHRHDQPAGSQARARGRDLLLDDGPRHRLRLLAPGPRSVTVEMIIDNLTQNAKTAQQVIAGVVDGCRRRTCECAHSRAEARHHHAARRHPDSSSGTWRRSSGKYVASSVSA
jgi:5'-methylthioadenosine phosphorylase